MKKKHIISEFDNLPNSALITVMEVAALFCIHPNSVWRLAKLGKLPKPVKLSNQSTRWRVGEIRKALSNLKVVGADGIEPPTACV